MYELLKKGTAMDTCQVPEAKIANKWYENCFLTEQKHAIHFLQETHIKASLQNYVRATWGYDLWIAGNSSYQIGVAILLNFWS